MGKLVVAVDRQFTKQNLDQLYVLVSSAHETTRLCEQLLHKYKAQRPAVCLKRYPRLSINIGFRKGHWLSVVAVQSLVTKTDEIL